MHAVGDLANLFAMAKQMTPRIRLAAAALIGTVAISGCAGGPSSGPDRGGAAASADAVTALRGRGTRVVVASYLLSEGLFQDRLRDSGADLVTDPLGTHPGVARLIANRFLRAYVPTQRPAGIAFHATPPRTFPRGLQFRR